MPDLQFRKEPSEVLLGRALDALDVLIARGHNGLTKTRTEIETHLDGLLRVRILEAHIALVDLEDEVFV